LRLSKGVLAVQIAHRLQAAESAMKNAKKALIHDHISEGIERPLKAAGSASRARPAAPAQPARPELFAYDEQSETFSLENPG
jgi:hypothetical protein